jgi:hypothetical protein
MNERLGKRVAALESKAGTTDRPPITIIHRIFKPGPNGPIWLYDRAADGTILRKNEDPAALTEEPTK